MYKGVTKPLYIIRSYKQPRSVVEDWLKKIGKSLRNWYTVKPYNNTKTFDDMGTIGHSILSGKRP